MKIISEMIYRVHISTTDTIRRNDSDSLSTVHKMFKQVSFGLVLASIATAVDSTITAGPPAQLSSFLPSPKCTLSICVDYINSCGRWYGGCYANCPGSTTPIFTDPGCSTTGTTATITPSINRITSSTCTSTLCVDYINSCGTCKELYPARCCLIVLLIPIQG